MVQIGSKIFKFSDKKIIRFIFNGYWIKIDLVKKKVMVKTKYECKCRGIRCNTYCNMCDKFMYHKHDKENIKCSVCGTLIDEEYKNRYDFGYLYVDGSFEFKSNI